MDNQQKEIKTIRIGHNIVQFYVDVHARLGWEVQSISEGIGGINSASFGNTSSFGINNASIFSYPALSQSRIHGSGLSTGFQSDFSTAKVNTLMTIIFTRPRDYPSRNEILALEDKIWPLTDQYIASCQQGQENKALWTECNQLITQAEALTREDLREFNAGLAVFKNGDYTGAVEHFEKAISVNPNEKKYWNEKGNALRWDGKFDEALEAYDKALELDANYAGGLSGKALSIIRKANDSKALELIGRAIEIEPKNVTFLENQGSIYKKLERIDKAIESYQKAVKLNRNDYGAWASLSELHVLQSKFNEALKCISISLELNPKNAQYLQTKGNILVNLRKYNKAIECFNKALDIKPDEDSIKNDLNTCIEKQKEDPEADKSLFSKITRGLFKKGAKKEEILVQKDKKETQKIQTEPIEIQVDKKVISPNIKVKAEKVSNVQAKRKVSSEKISSSSTEGKVIQWQKKQNELSKDKIKEAEKAYKDGNKFMNKKDYVKAEELIIEAIKLNPYEPIYQDMLGYVYKTHGKYKETLNCFEKLLKIDGMNSDWIRGKVEALCLLKRFDEAEKILEFVKSQHSFNGYFKRSLGLTIDNLKMQVSRSK